MKMIDKIVDMVIEGLESGTVAWRKTWKDFSPVNAFTERSYNGFNILFLSFMCAKYGYSYPLFGTFKQISDAGGRVKKGERSCSIVYWKVTDTKEQDGSGNEILCESERRFCPFYYNVFNLDQAEGIDIEKYASIFSTHKNNPMKTCEQVINHMPNSPEITHDQPGAFYVPFSDKVNVPEIYRFDSSEEYYAAIFHELAHSTGHSSRLNRFEDNNSAFGRYSYNYEELVAEMAATFLCSHCGIELTVDNSVAYLTGWAKFLKENRKTTLFGAATKAQAAVNYIFGKSITGEQPGQVEENRAVAVF
jgi:antirestriction protein ArdC